MQIVQNVENVQRNYGDSNVDYQGYVCSLISTLYRRNQKRHFVPRADQEKVVNSIQIPQLRVMALRMKKSNTVFTTNA